MREEKKLETGISLCMIVRNEAATLARTVSSVREIVDEVIIVDTGSTDNTVAVAKGLLANVYSFEWKDDFALARNFSISKAHFSWILVLDADEVIARRDLKVVRSIISNGKYSAGVFNQRNYCDNPESEGWTANTTDYEEGRGFSGFSDLPIIRLFKNSPSIYYEGIIHEVVDASIALTKKKYLNIPIHHFTRLASDNVNSFKNEQYCRLLLKDFELHPDNPRTCLLLGRHYQAMEQYAEAIVFLKRAIEYGTRSELAYENLGSVYFACGMYNDAVEILEKGMALNPRYPDLITMLGIAYYELGQKDKSIELLKQSIALQPLLLKACFNLGAIYYKEKQYAEAQTYIEQALKLSPQIPRIQYIMFFIYYYQNNWAFALETARRLQNMDERLYQKIEHKVREAEVHICAKKGALQQ